MTVKPWAKATAATPGRPAPPPTTAAAPAPMNISAKVPMNSARSLAAIRLDIVNSRDEIDGSARSGFEERFVGWGWLAAQASCRQPSNLFRGDRSRFKIEAQRLCYAGPVGRI